MIKYFIIAYLFLLGPAALAQQMQPEVPLENPQQEQRARELFRELRCEVCAGQTIADSNAALAQDMRGSVRQKIAAGQSDETILNFFAERYGDSILMRPPLTTATAPLWLAPLFVVLLGGWFMMRYFARKKNTLF